MNHCEFMHYINALHFFYDVYRDGGGR